MTILHTPKRKAILWVLALVSLLAQPAIETVYYRTSLERGMYPTNADSIGIPIAQFFMAWIVALPLLVTFIWFALREYPGKVSFLAFNVNRPIWSSVWSALLGLAAASFIVFAAQSAVRLYPLDVVNAVLSTYLLLCFRSSLVYSTAFTKRTHDTARTA